MFLGFRLEEIQMISKKLVSGLIVVLFNLTFATYATESAFDNTTHADDGNSTDTKIFSSTDNCTKVEDASIDKSCNVDDSADNGANNNMSSCEVIHKVESCGCEIFTDCCGCTEIYLCEQHSQFLDDWCTRWSKSYTDTSSSHPSISN